MRFNAKNGSAIRNCWIASEHTPARLSIRSCDLPNDESFWRRVRASETTRSIDRERRFPVVSPMVHAFAFANRLEKRRLKIENRRSRDDSRADSHFIVGVTSTTGGLCRRVTRVRGTRAKRGAAVINVGEDRTVPTKGRRLDREVSGDFIINTTSKGAFLSDLEIRGARRDYRHILVEASSADFNYTGARRTGDRCRERRNSDRVNRHRTLDCRALTIARADGHSSSCRAIIVINIAVAWRGAAFSCRRRMSRTPIFVPASNPEFVPRVAAIA